MKRLLVICFMITALLVFLFFPKEPSIESYYGVENEMPSVEITIDGEVIFPGSYTFFYSPTYEDVIDIAGGLLDDADVKSINMRKYITQNLTIHIPSKTKEETQINVLININEASFSELLEIPYMTETKAANLIIYREAHGAFSSIDDLINVKYIGAATLEKIRPYITI